MVQGGVLGKAGRWCQQAASAVEKPLYPLAFPAERAYSRHCQYTTEGSARALSQSFAPATQPERPSSSYWLPLGSQTQERHGGWAEATH